MHALRWEVIWSGWRCLQWGVAVAVRPLVAVADQKHPATWCIPWQEAMKPAQKVKKIENVDKKVYVEREMIYIIVL